MAELVARRYAHAIFELALERDTLLQTEEEVSFVKEVFTQNDDFLKVIKHPHVTAEDKKQALENVFKGKISDDIFALMSLVVKKNREPELMEILECFLELAKKHKGIVSAKILSATELSMEQIEKIKGTISKNMNKQVEVQTTVDPSLIGGVYIEVDGKVIDGTVKKQMTDMKKSLLNLQLV